MNHIDPRMVKPSVLLKMINSASLGEVLGERRLHRHRNRAGFKIGDDKHINAFRYAAWLMEQRQARLASEAEGGWYGRHKNSMGQKSREEKAAFNDIGPLPDVVDPSRRERAEKDLALWAETYCKPRRRQEDSKNHALMYDRFQSAIESKEGWFAIQAPRGEAKTTKFIEAVAWAMASGRKKFPIGFSSSGATMGLSAESFASIFTLPLIQEDYPEIAYPVKLIGVSKNRQLLYKGEPIRLTWGVNDHGKIRFHFPDIPESVSRFSHLIVSPIDTKLRGFFYASPKGEIVRPDVAFLDDLQDPEIAANPERVQKFWDKMTVDIAGLSGDDPMPIIHSGTPLGIDCLMSRSMKDRRFSGISLKAIYHYPDNMELWNKYLQVWENAYDEKVLEYGIYAKDQASNEAFQIASRFYQENQAAMDAGMEMAWPARYAQKYGGVSAIENIMREYLIILGPDVFEQEKNCIVIPRNSEEVEEITEEIFLSKVDKSLRHMVSPNESELITYAIDVHENILYYQGVAWSNGFDGHVIDYGTYPEQPNQNFSQKNVRLTLRRKYQKAGENGALLAGLNDLTNKLMQRHYMREDGSLIYIDKILVDDNNGLFHETVQKFSEESEYREKIVCYIGDYSPGQKICL